MDLLSKEKTPAQEAYERYGEARRWETFDGRPMPQWDEIGVEIQAAWIAAISFPMELSDRERVQIAHATNYANVFESAGAPGHGQFILIAKLARALGLS